MHIISTAIICAVRPHGEAGAIVRAFTAEHGLLAGYVQGAKGRHLRPVLIPGNEIKGDWRARILGQLPSLVAEQQHSRAHLLGEPLAVSAIDWVTALTAATLGRRLALSEAAQRVGWRIVCGRAGPGGAALGGSSGAV